MWPQTDAQTDRQTDTQTRVTTTHFASSTSHVKCNYRMSSISCWLPPWRRRTSECRWRIWLVCFIPVQEGDDDVTQSLAGRPRRPRRMSAFHCTRFIIVRLTPVVSSHAADNNAACRNDFLPENSSLRRGRSIAIVGSTRSIGRPRRMTRKNFNMCHRSRLTRLRWRRR